MSTFAPLWGGVSDATSKIVDRRDFEGIEEKLVGGRDAPSSVDGVMKEADRRSKKMRSRQKNGDEAGCPKERED